MESIFLSRGRGTLLSMLLCPTLLGFVCACACVIKKKKLIHLKQGDLVGLIILKLLSLA